MFNEHVQSRSAQAAATRQRVLDAAEKLFRRAGYDATTVRQIAADAGVSVGTVMSVGDKDALLLAVFDRWIEAVHQQREETTPRAGSATIAILELFAPFLTHFAKDRDLARHYAAIIARGSHETPIFHSLAKSLVNEIVDVLHREGFNPQDASRRADAIYLSYIGLLMTASNGAIDEAAVIIRLRDVIDLVAAAEGTLQ